MFIYILYIIYIYIYLYLNACYIFFKLYIFVYVYVYICFFIYVYMSIYIYIYIYIFAAYFPGQEREAKEIQWRKGGSPNETQNFPRWRTEEKCWLTSTSVSPGVRCSVLCSTNCTSLLSRMHSNIALQCWGGSIYKNIQII